jgi:hypothetical protein
MLARTGFPEYLESIAIGPDPEFLKTQTDLCDVAAEFPQEVNAMYLWKKIATSADPIVELRDFVKHFLLDGPDFSEEFILHFIKQVNMLPPDLKDQIMYEIDDAFSRKRQGTPPPTYDPIANTFNEISDKIASDVSKRKFNKSRAVNDDPDFLDKLSGMMDSCKSSCNYFAPVTDKIGSIFDFSRMNSLNASMPQDAELNAPPPTGLGLNIMNKIPRGIQNTLMEAYTSAKLLADAAKEQLTSPGTTQKLREFAKQGVSAERKGVPFIGSTGSSLFQDALGLNSSLMTKVKRNMGDCFRIADFLNRYNAFDEDMNLAVAKKKVFKMQIPDASLGGAKRAWSGSAQGVSSGDGLGSEPWDNNTTPQYALKPQTTGDARNYDDAPKAAPRCPGDTPVGQASDNATPVAGTPEPFQGMGGDVPVGSNGKIKPADLQAYTEDRIKNSKLNGYVPADGAKYGIDGSPKSWSNFFNKLAAAESGYNVNSTNTTDPGGSYGIFQVAPADGKRYGANPTGQNWTVQQLRDPKVNTDTAIKIFEKNTMKSGRIESAGGKGAGGYFAAASMRKIANSVR